MALLLLCAGCDPFNTDFADLESAVDYEASAPVVDDTARTELRVMTWNIKFGGGRIDFFFDCHGDRVLMSESEVVENLEGLKDLIDAQAPDILLLQEVDVLSKRSAYVDMVQWLLDHTELSHGVYASQWKADFVPSDGIGRVDSGNAILSRWPIDNATRIALPLIGEQDGLTQYFYLKRNILRGQIQVPGAGELHVINTHLAAYSSDGTKKKQIDQVVALMDELDAAGKTFIMGGDLNTMPAGTEKRTGFDDQACEGDRFSGGDSESEETWLDDLYASYEPAIALDTYQADNSPWFTHSTAKDVLWNRKLDYLFTNAIFDQSQSLTIQTEDVGGYPTMPLSDHAPTFTIWEVAP